MRNYLARARCAGPYVLLLHVCFPRPAPCLADLLVGTAFEGGVWRLDEMTGAQLPGGVPPGSAGLALTSGVTVGPDGNIYVSSRGTGEVLFYDGDSGLPLPSPHAGERPGLFATLAIEATPTSTPGPLRFGPDGQLYVSDFGGVNVRKYDGTTGEELAVAATAFVGPPAGLAFDAMGNLYVGDFGSASVIRVSGGVPSLFIAPQSGGLLTPSSLLFLPDGDLLVVDLYGDQILRYAADGTFIEQFAQIDIDLGEDPPPNPDPSDYPSDIAFDANGNLVVAVLGPTRPSNPPDPPTPTFGTILRFDLEGGAPLQTIISEQTPLGSIAWIPSVDAMPGDYDSSGSVDPADYEKWQADFGKWVAKGGGADGNGDGIVDAADYVVWRNAMDAGVAAGAALPEPATALLALIGAALICSLRFATTRRV